MGVGRQPPRSFPSGFESLDGCSSICQPGKSDRTAACKHAATSLGTLLLHRDLCLSALCGRPAKCVRKKSKVSKINHTKQAASTSISARKAAIQMPGQHENPESCWRFDASTARSHSVLRLLSSQGILPHKHLTRNMADILQSEFPARLMLMHANLSSSLRPQCSLHVQSNSNSCNADSLLGMLSY